MEPHKVLELGPDFDAPSLSDKPTEYFRKALKFALEHYGEEIERISSVKPENVTPDFFFKEYVWVVHATGFSAKAVGNFMPRLLEAYGPWETLSKESFGDVMERVKVVCNNPQKARAVQETARLMSDRVYGGDGASKEERWDEFKTRMFTTTALAELPYIGKVTCFHLGRNVGLLDCVKPDLHFVRMAEHWGFADCTKMCESMQTWLEEETGEKLPLGVIDLILWYSASSWGTSEIKKPGKRLLMLVRHSWR
jgi:endonuclease III